jgi:uncharacterized protein (DUF885 family)
MARRALGLAALALAAALAVLAMAAALPAPARAQEASHSVETQRLLEWLRDKAAERSPNLAAAGSWGDYSDETAAERAAQVEADLAELRAAFDPASLDVEGLVEFRVYEHQAEQQLRDQELREQSYIFMAYGGPHQDVASIVTFGIYRPPGGPAPGPQAGEAYVARIEAVGGYLDEVRAEFDERAARGVVPPKWVLAELIAQCESTLEGAPFEAGPPSGLLAAVSRSTGGLDASETEKTELLNRASAALANDLEPAYRRLIASFERLEPDAPDAFGMWAAGEAGAVYDGMIAAQTSTALTAGEARAIGERELARIHAEMVVAAPEGGFEGSAAALFDYMRTDDQFYYPNTDEGRAAYLAEARRVIDAMKARLGEVVPAPPDAPLEVRRYPPEQERQAIAGMYQAGGRPIAGDAAEATSAAYVVALADMSAAPKYFLQPLAHHEGLPGHHLQFMLEDRRAARAAAATGVSAQALVFAQPRSFGAHAEGWALYAEELPRELGLYTDSWSVVGQLGMEAWRAARLVVDVGIHAEGWSRDEAIAFLLANTPLTETQARIEVDRYARLPGQATSYMIGKLAIEDARERAEAALGEDFDLRAFHDQVLGHGGLPLPVLDEVIDRWIAAVMAER